jgi:predicted transcriptional regulator of viral defense system
MTSLEQYIEEQLIRGRSSFSKEEAIKTLRVSTDAFTAAASRLTKKQRLVSPWRGFYLILRPEDRVQGAPDPVRWIDPLMKHLKLDYRISLLRAAAFHGSSHQAAMVFQVIVPKQLRSFEIGRYRIQFVYLSPIVFEETNQSNWVQQLKSETGFAKVAGVELTLLDSARYFHKAGGINGLAQIVHDVGIKANPRILSKAAQFYENSAVRRLGYLLDHFGETRQCKSLMHFVRVAKSMKPLDPSIKPLIEGMPLQKNAKWMLAINETVEIDE